MTTYPPPPPNVHNSNGNSYTCSVAQDQFWRDFGGKIQGVITQLKAVAIHMCLHLLSGKNFGEILVGNTRCFGGISHMPENRP